MSVAEEDIDIMLEQLLEDYRYREPREKELATLNPDTSPNTLLQFAQSCPGAFLKNPVIPLLLLENPNFLCLSSSKAAKALLHFKGCPAWVFHSLAFHPEEEIRFIVARHNKTPLSSLEVLAKDKEAYVRLGVARNVKAPLSLLDVLARDESEYVRACVAKNVSAPIELLELLFMDESAMVHESAAKSDNLPPALSEVLAARRKAVGKQTQPQPGNAVVFGSLPGKDLRSKVKHFLKLSYASLLDPA